MRIKLELAVQPGTLLPFNYQYALSSWVYKVLLRQAPEFGTWLHNQGYGEGAHRYKLFTFDQLNVRPFRIANTGKHLEILGDRISWALSFFVNAAGEGFLKGLFREQNIELVIPQSGKLNLEVLSVNILPAPDFTEQMSFRTLTPICVSAQAEGTRSADYLSPQDVRFSTHFMSHLQRKYNSARLFFDELPEVEESAFKSYRFLLRSIPKSQLISIKPGTQEETKVRGYRFDFSVQLPPEVQRFAYFAGFGEKNSLGFGFVLPVQRDSKRLRARVG